MEKIKARFLVPTEETENKVASIKTKGLSFSYSELSEKQEKRVREQMSRFYLEEDCCYEYEYDDYDDGPSRSYSSKEFEIGELLSLSTPYYSTDAPCADIIVVGGSFEGIILKISSVGGNGFDNYNDWWYTILYTDGTMLGKNKSSYYFSGESSSKSDEKTYNLKEKKN